jgi:hypothetical protein
MSIERDSEGEKPLKCSSKGGSKESSGEDRTAIELFIAGVRGWEAELRQFVDRE